MMYRTGRRVRDNIIQVVRYNMILYSKTRTLVMPIGNNHFIVIGCSKF